MKTLASWAAAVTALIVTTAARGQVPQLINYQGRVIVGGVNFKGTGQFRFALVDGGTNAAVQATGTANLTGGFVTSITVTNGGTGYTSAPAVTMSGGGGSGAAAASAISAGVVTSVTVTSAGFGYTSAPTVTIAPPPSSVAFATYWSNDGTSSAGSEPTAVVSLPVTKGLYSVLLGDTGLTNMTAIPANVFNNSDVRLRVWFDDGANGSQLLTPDQRIVAVGYSMIAGNVQDGAITVAKIANGAVGSAQIGTGAIGTAHLAAGAVQSANLASGAVGSAQLAVNAVQGANLAAGSVGSSQLATGAVGFTNLAKPPQAGTLDGSALLATYGNGPFTVTFPQAYSTIPIVTASLTSASATVAVVQVTNVTASGFSGVVSNYEPPTVTVDRTGDVGITSSLATVNGNPAISYSDATNEDLKYVRATDPAGTAWGTPITIDSAGFVGRHSSLAVVDGNPAISYHDSGLNDLKYVRATNTDGTTWSLPITIDSTGYVGLETSLAVVNGNPAISYRAGNLDDDLKFVRATDTAGTAWGTPITIESAGRVGYHSSLAVVNGNPAVSYWDFDGILKFVRATNVNGTAWGTPMILDNLGPDAGGGYTFSALVYGNPAISYQGGSKLKYVRATNAAGTAWSTPITLDSTEVVNGQVGFYTSLAVINGTPAISYASLIEPTLFGLKFVRATDATGSAWATRLDRHDLQNQLDRSAALSVGRRAGLPLRKNWEPENQ